MSEDTESYWNKTGKRSVYPRLKNNLEADVLIIGSGITGVTCAWCLAQAGKKPVLIEAGSLCDGTTGNTTGKVTIQHGLIYGPLDRKYGREFAAQYAQSQTEALDFVCERVKKESIDCQLTENTAWIFTASPEKTEELHREYEVAKELNIDAEFQEHPGFPPGSLCAVGFRHQAVFHPVRYVEALAQAAVRAGAQIYCDTKAVGLENGGPFTVLCERGINIRAHYVVMATQYPFYDGPNVYFTRLYPRRTYGVAVQAERDWPDGSFINAEDPGRSVRTHAEDGGRVLIVVGEGHATARGEDNTGLHYENLVRYAQEIAGVKKQLARWSAQDYLTPDHVPYIGRASDRSDLYVACGFGKWGLTSGTLAGRMIARLVTEGHCRYEDIYSRERGDLGSSAGTVISEVMGSVGELIKSKFESPESIRDLKPGEGRVIRYEGHKAGIYRDEHDDVTILDISCTHMTTGLNFNAAEKTWDCPAHGGRFAADGRLLEGPPKDPLRVLFHGRFSDLTTGKQR